MIDYLGQGRTINGEYYAGEFKWLCQEIVRKRRGKLICGVLLLHDVAPFDFYLFRKLKSHPHGTQYGGNEVVIELVKEYFEGRENAFYF